MCYCLSSAMLRLVTFSRLVALALLLCIAQDLVADALCDTRPRMGGENVVISTNGPQDDSCASVCVPDCFCCCVGTESDPSVVVEDRGRVVTTTERPPAPQLDGASVSIFHPPLLRA